VPSRSQGSGAYCYAAVTGVWLREQRLRGGAAIRAVELEPDRGRARDLVRLHELVAELTELLTPDP
jgi:hypothetical protein